MTFEEIYRLYGKKVLNLAYRFTGSEETARDLTQDVFVKVYQNLSTFQGKSQIYTWIYRVAVNHCLNFLKKERKWRLLSLLDQKISDAVRSDHLQTELPDPAEQSSPAQMLEKAEREIIVRTRVNDLPLKYRAPLVLQRYEGMNNREIAEVLSLSLGTVETRIHRAKKMLIKKLEPWVTHL